MKLEKRNLQLTTSNSPHDAPRIIKLRNLQTAVDRLTC